jgi:hypothetical protein
MELPPQLLDALRQRAHSTRPTDQTSTGDSDREISRLRAPLPPASADQLAASERQLGFRLPTVVQQLYTQVANGGFGPGYGLLGLVGGAVDEFGDTAVESYLQRRGRPPPRRWPAALVPICAWGCITYECVDCRSEHAPLVYFDPGRWGTEADNWSPAFQDTGYNLAEWLQDWADLR